MDLKLVHINGQAFWIPKNDVRGSVNTIINCIKNNTETGFLQHHEVSIAFKMQNTINSYDKNCSAHVLQILFDMTLQFLFHDI